MDKSDFLPLVSTNQTKLPKLRRALALHSSHQTGYGLYGYVDVYDVVSLRGGAHPVSQVLGAGVSFGVDSDACDEFDAYDGKGKV
jgi:hypothetical protein